MAVYVTLSCQTQEIYIAEYRKTEILLRNKQAINKFLRTFPRYMIEAVGLIMISIIGLYLSIAGIEVLPILGTLALGSQRLLPSMQQIYRGWATLALYQPSMNVFGLVSIPIENKYISSKYDSTIKLANKIRFENVSFSYDSKVEIIKNLNLEIAKGERLGIIGSTGSGKSTFLDLMMGLLEPTHGRIYIDGEKSFSDQSSFKVADWMKSIAHVPQTIHLTDQSFEQNVLAYLLIKSTDRKYV